MSKRYLENCLSKEKRAYESNVQKYKRLIEQSGSREYPTKLEKVPIAIAEVASTFSESDDNIHIETDDEFSFEAEKMLYEAKKFGCFYERFLCRSEVLKANGVKVGSKTKPTKFSVRLFVCDSPARAFVTGNIFESAEECSGTLAPGQDALPRGTYMLSCEPSNIAFDPANISALLNQLIEGQKTLMVQIEKLEANQETILKNQLTLSNGQGVLNANQEQLANTLAKINSDIVSKAEMMAQSKLIMECKVAAQRAQKSLGRLTGETSDSATDKIAAMLPLRTVVAIKELEEKLESEDFAQAMAFPKMLVLSSVQYSRMTSLKNIIGMGDVFANQGTLELQQNIKRAVDRAHHRVKQKRYINANK
ncbi:hypothetical protein EVAR_101475_1 [Eumeta japonica]|uniref:Uncharacterized protein n=1 Tax=Eumeta variegata TaxID=151549 RepID=A0A4C1TCD6_EUMVA|nr:hypothetical protein EVAR_101475_1 [Eumeta japonica]